MRKVDYIFETSWEVCNKVGGIYTVVSTKATTVVDQLKDNYICIGPDLSDESNNHNYFVEDPYIFKNWKETAQREGLRIRIGRWKISGSPVVVLVDFTPFFEKKNDIFTELWLQYQLDSISGQWDYIEPALFGYAAGKVIESFYNFYCTSSDGIIAQFHEWMTGTGALYLRNKVPQISTVFTTHATVLGRCIAGNGLPLYGDMESFNPTDMANRFGVQSKHSLESVSAQVSDAFTTVSAITDRECVNFLKKKADVLTINGFENDFVPKGDEYHEKRQIARNKLLNVSRALLQQPISDDALFVISSGRYEYRNKGLDLFTEGLAKLQEQNPDREVVAMIAVPAGTNGIREDLLSKMDAPVGNTPVLSDYTTHPLHDPSHDQVINGFKKYGLNNAPESKVKVIFIPVYLNGHDGIFNLEYYDLLIGFDLTIFPSYYEPWGYTPLESAAFGIPTVTTSLAGFGKWVEDNFPPEESIWVIHRDDKNDNLVSDEIAKSIAYYAACEPKQLAIHQQKAVEIAQHALWKNLFTEYEKAYEIAIRKADERFDLYKDKTSTIPLLSIIGEKPSPNWKKVTIKSNLPSPLNHLIEMANNVWWSWNYEARELFEEIIGYDVWTKQGENPVGLLQLLPLETIEIFLKDTIFLKKLDSVYRDFQNYLSEPRKKDEKQVAYFSMEYGLSNEIKTFSGGLGMLAGDYLKEASDSNVNMVGIGLLYRNGYFSQQISPAGEQINLYPRQSFSRLPIQPIKNEEGEWQRISIALPGRNLYARIWKIEVGRIPLYLLDTDFSDNWDEDRGTTATLYGGDQENRLKQELLLGVGGIRMLNLLGIHPDVYHLNEGHAAFIILERLRNLMQEQHHSLPVATELIRASSLYTTHTPVPAGHDAFSEDLMRKYFSNYPERFNISWESFMAFGRNNKNDINEKFSMSTLACNFSQEINGVSRIHGRVTRKMFSSLYEGYFPEELPIGYVTNGVHYPTWAHKSWQHFHQHLFGKDFLQDQTNPKIWERIYEASNEDIWRIKSNLRAELMSEVKCLLEKQMRMRNESPASIINTLNSIRSDALTIGFARRFATYKRAHLLFSNEETLARLVNTPERPIIFLFAGKAHPHDKAGQDLIKKIIDISKQPRFVGKIIFLENYDMILAKKLVSGCDVWLNTPTRPLEASGTSGEKAVMNGVLNFSVLDGWWAEGYVEGAGWAIKEENTYDDTQLQDELDAATLYYLLEHQVVQAFYQRNSSNTPEYWTNMMKNNFAKIAPHYTMKRQLNDYYSKFYSKLEKRSDDLTRNQMEGVLQLVKWKSKMMAAWENIEVINVTYPDTSQHALFLGENLNCTIEVRLGNISPEDVAIELLIADREDGKNLLKDKIPFRFLKTENRISTFSCDITIDHVGAFNLAIRMVPSHPSLPYSTDLNLVKWL